MQIKIGFPNFVTINRSFNTFLFIEGDLVACNNISGLMAALNIAHDPHEWRLFIDAPKISLKGPGEECMGYNKSLKIYFLDSHLDFFSSTCGAVSGEHSEKFHQNISSMEKRYQGKWSSGMLADYSWTVTRDIPFSTYCISAKSKSVEQTLIKD